MCRGCCVRLAAQLAAVRRLAAHGLPLYCGGRKRRMVALTFDDGPGPYTRLAIKQLRRKRLHATFFLVGKQIRAYQRLAGREKSFAAVGDHTMTHPFLPALSHAAMVREIVRCSDGDRARGGSAGDRLPTTVRGPYAGDRP